MKCLKKFAISGQVMLASMAVAVSAWADTPGFITAATLGGVSASDNSFHPKFTADGRHVVFLSEAKNLVPGSNPRPYLDLFVHDLFSQQTRLVSTRLIRDGGADLHVAFPSLAYNGQQIAFASAAGNLVANDTNGASDVFVRDMATGEIVLVSLDTAGHVPAELQPASSIPLSTDPQISPNGRWVVFTSRARGLTGQSDTNGVTDIFLRDLAENITYLLSRNAAGDASGNGRSYSPCLALGAAKVAFISRATDLLANGSGSATEFPTNSYEEVYVRELPSGPITWASAGAAAYFSTRTNETPQGYTCITAALSDQGRYVAYKARAVATILMVHDLETGTNTLVDTEVSMDPDMSFSADGRFLVYGKAQHIYVWNQQTQSNILVDVAFTSNDPSTGASHTPVISADGRSVAFISTATNLVADVTNGVSQLYVRDLEHNTTHLVTRCRSGSPSERPHDQAMPVLSRDGLRVAFASMEDQLVDGDHNMASDVFVSEWKNGTIQLVSKRDPNLMSATVPGYADFGPFKTKATSERPLVVNSNATRLVFISNDRGAAYGDTNQSRDVYLKDLTTSSLQIVNPEPLAETHRISGPIEPVISANGRYVAYGRWQTLYGTNQPIEIICKDLESGTVQVIATNLPAQRFSFSGGYNMLNLSVTSEGRFVVYDNYTNAFRYDRISGTNELLVMTSTNWPYYWEETAINPVLSPNEEWLLASRDRLLMARKFDSPVSWRVSSTYLHGVTFSGDSRFVAFVESGGTNLATVVHDIQTQTNVAYIPNSVNPSLSEDGRLVAFERRYQNYMQITVHDRQTGREELISANCLGSGPGSGDSRAPQISGDGRYVVFVSEASDLAPFDSNGTTDIFVRDRIQDTTLLVSRSHRAPAAANGKSTAPLLCRDGRTVLFQSFASDLLANDYNAEGDLFVLRLGAGDTDNDGLPDDWELAHFNTLEKTGTADSDGDGQSDLQEYLAGTSPNNQTEALQVLTLLVPGQGTSSVLWSSVPGKTYQVQYKDELDDPAWRDLGSPVVATSTSTSAPDAQPPAQGQRFYRVVLLSY